MGVAALIVILLLGGGTSYAAQSAVPGDALYPVKVDVNDNVRSLLAVSDQAKAKLNLDLAHERLVEAQQLAAQGKLNATTTAELKKDISDNYQEGEKHSQAIAANGDIQTAGTVRASFEGMFKSYADVLKNIDTQVKGNQSAELISDLEGYASSSAQAQAKEGSHVNASAKAQVTATISHANGLITATKQQLSNTKASLSTTTYSIATARLGEAEQDETDAQASLDSGDMGDAYEKAQSAISAATEAKTMSETSIRLAAQLKSYRSEEDGSDRGSDEGSEHGQVGTGTQMRSGEGSDHEGGDMQVGASSTLRIRTGDDGGANMKSEDHTSGGDGTEGSASVKTDTGASGDGVSASSTGSVQIKLPGGDD